MRPTIEEVRLALQAAKVIAVTCALSRASLSAGAGLQRRGRRIHLGMTLGDLAERAGVSVVHVSDLERGIHVPDVTRDAIDTVLHRGCPGCSSGSSGSSSAAVLIALCEAEIERRTARWVDTPYMVDAVMVLARKLVGGADRDEVGRVADHKAWRPRLPWSATLADVKTGATRTGSTFVTEPEARAWVEAQARAEGWEVARG